MDLMKQKGEKNPLTYDQRLSQCRFISRLVGSTNHVNGSSPLKMMLKRNVKIFYFQTLPSLFLAPAQQKMIGEVDRFHLNPQFMG